MLRSILRRPRSIRVPVENGNVEVQRVKVVRHKRYDQFSCKPTIADGCSQFSIVTTALAGWIVWKTSDYWMPENIRRARGTVNSEFENAKRVQEIRKQRKEYSEHWGKKHAEIAANKNVRGGGNEEQDLSATDSIVLKVPLWIRTREQQMYTESDKDWKAFALLQGDKKRVDALKKEIAKAVGKQLHKAEHLVNLQHIAFKGKVGLALDVVPPIYPPDIYEMPAIFVTPTSITTGWTPLPDTYGPKMARILHPVIFAKAMAAGVQEFVYASYIITKARVSDRIGSTKSESTTTNPITGVVEIAKAQTQEEEAKARFLTSRASEKNLTAMFPFLRGEFGEKEGQRQYRDVVKAMTYQTAIEQSVAVFQQRWMSAHLRALQASPQGGLQIRGFIDCFGMRGKYRLEVIAVYLPSDNAFVGKPIITGSYIIADLTKFKDMNDHKGILVEGKMLEQPKKDMTEPPANASARPASESAHTDKEEDK